MPMKTEDPCAPAGQVPIGAWFSAARAKRGSADAANNPPAALRTDRRVTCPVQYRFIDVSLSESGDDVSFHDRKSSAAARRVPSVSGGRRDLRGRHCFIRRNDDDDPENRASSSAQRDGRARSDRAAARSHEALVRAPAGAAVRPPARAGAAPTTWKCPTSTGCSPDNRPHAVLLRPVGTQLVNRLKYLGALVAASLLVNACGAQAPSEEQADDTGREVASVGPATPGSSPGVDVFPYALPGATFPVTVSLPNSSGQLANVAGTVTVKLSANPTGAILLGSTTKALVNGVARFDLSIAKAGQGYAITASSSQGGTSTSVPFNVAYSQDVGSPGYTLSSAAAISPKVPMFGALNPGEVHYYKFPATAGQQLSVSTYADRLDADWDASMRVRLIGPDGNTELARAGAAGADAPEVDNGLSLVRIAQDGDYYLACDLDQPGRRGGKYAVVMTLATDPGIALQTEAEPWGTSGRNDTIATAQKLNTGTLYGHYDSTATGAATSDFYAIAIVNPVRVRLDLNAARSGAAYGDRAWVGRLELQDASGAVLWANDKSYGLDPAIDYVITKVGTYYVRVTTSNDQPNGRSSPYFLNYQATPYIAGGETMGKVTASAATRLRYGSGDNGSFPRP